MVDWMKRLAAVRSLAVTAAALAATVVLVLVAAFLIPSNPEFVDVPVEDGAPVVPSSSGWAGRAALADAWSRIKGEFEPRFRLLKADGTEASPTGRPAKLYLASYAVFGRSFDTYRQLRGDCVANAVCNAIRIRVAVQIANGEDQTYREPFRPYIYGISRTYAASENGFRGFGCARGDNGHGSLVSLAIYGAKKWGVLYADDSGVPEYSGAVVDQWSCLSTWKDAKTFVAIAESRKMGDASRLTSVDDVDLALENGYPVAVGFSLPFNMRGRVETIAGKQKLVGSLGRGRNWNHAECLIAKEDGYYYLWNSWDENPHGANPPGDDAPAGGFWIARDVVARIVKDEAFAVSSQGGFEPVPWVFSTKSENVRPVWDGVIEPGGRDE